jgi:hypothetical protein
VTQTELSHASLVRTGVRRLDALSAQVVELRRRVALLDPTQRASLLIPLRQLDRRLSAAEAALARLNFAGPDNWEEQADRVDTSLGDLRRAADLIAADLATLDADEPAAFRLALARRAEAWQTYAEELALQAHLAGLDLRSQLDSVRRCLRDVRHAAIGGSGGWDQLRAEANVTMQEAATMVSEMARRVDAGR